MNNTVRIVAASSMEGLKTSEAIVRDMQACRNMMEQILSLAK